MYSHAPYEAASAADIRVLDFAQFRERLGHTENERRAICHNRGDDFGSKVVEAHEADAEVSRYAGAHDVWIGVNPTGTAAGETAKRGSAEDILRLAAVAPDIDIKPGAFGTAEQATTFVNDLAAALGTEPSVWVWSDHGLQPYWPIDRDGAELLTNAEAAALARAFGRFVQRLARELYGVKLDSVFVRVCCVYRAQRIGRTPTTRSLLLR